MESIHKGPCYPKGGVGKIKKGEGVKCIREALGVQTHKESAIEISLGAECLLYEGK